MRPKPVVLLILDGFGLREAADDNAIHHANTPTFDRLAKSGPSAQLETSGEAVGLPKGQMGNSEVGHMNLGTGRIVYQDFTRISKAIDEGDFETNEVLVSACRQAKAQGGTLHILGLLSPGGVHSHEDHIEAIDMIFHNGTVGETYCIGGKNEIKNIDLIKLIIKEFDYIKQNNNSSIDLISYVDDRLGHDYRYAIDISKIKNELGWEPKTNIMLGLKKTLIWYLNE